MIDSPLRKAAVVDRSMSLDSKGFRQSARRRVSPSLPGLLPAAQWTSCQDARPDNPVHEFPPPVKPKTVPTTPQALGMHDRVPISRSKSTVSTDSRRYSLQEKNRVNVYVNNGAPFGIAEMLANEDPEIAKRIFVLDNSGSTATPDGHVLRQECRGDGDVFHCQASTRWEEICTTAIDQAEWNGKAGVTCEFLLLNSPSKGVPVKGRDYAVIDPALGIIDAQVAALRQMLRQNPPCGPTPLTSRLAQLRQRLLKEGIDGKRIMLSIITDGLPSPTGAGTTAEDKSAFMRELRTFTSTFNSFVVIRLATDDDDTVQYYNKIDGELELPLDILDDLKGEAIEVYESGNGWFAYTPLIHRIREGGTMEKMFDLLDERPFTAVEIASFLEMILRRPGDAPFPRQAKELYERMQEIVPSAPLVYNGRLGRMTPAVDLKLLKKALGRTHLGRAKQMPGHFLRRARSLVSYR